jgi:hypothetical protein
MPNPRPTGKRDDNRVVTIMGVSSTNTTIAGKTYVTGQTPVPIAVNPVTKALIIEAA